MNIRRSSAGLAQNTNGEHRDEAEVNPLAPRDDKLQTCFLVKHYLNITPPALTQARSEPRDVKFGENLTSRESCSNEALLKNLFHE